jgi:hypothetical protein
MAKRVLRLERAVARRQTKLLDEAAGVDCCCGAPCCRCLVGETHASGGCCYRPGDRIRLTIPRPGLPPTNFGGVSFACFDDCNPPFLTHTYCCGSMSSAQASDLWVEYEAIAEEYCIVTEFDECEPVNAIPTPILIEPPGPGWTPPDPGGGNDPPGGGCDTYCHRVIVFVTAEVSPSVQELLDDGGSIKCIFPLEWWWVCSGCKKFENQVGCVVPEDHRPVSDLPCGYVTPSGDVYIAARPALGWHFVCDPLAIVDCPFCIGACSFGPDTTCTSETAPGQQILDSSGTIVACGVDACSNDPCCSIPDEWDPGCQATITLDLSRCDGGVICCHPRLWARLSCDIEDGYQCLELPTHVCTLERVGPTGCTWDESQRNCRTRLPGDPTPEPSLPECPDP